VMVMTTLPTHRRFGDGIRGKATLPRHDDQFADRAALRDRPSRNSAAAASRVAGACFSPRAIVSRTPRAVEVPTRSSAAIARSDHKTTGPVAGSLVVAGRSRSRKNGTALSALKAHETRWAATASSDARSVQRASNEEPHQVAPDPRLASRDQCSSSGHQAIRLSISYSRQG
jgi:hypothetical protein